MESINQRPILGIDPGLNITGYGLIVPDGSRPKLIEAGVVRGKSRGSLTGRLNEIYSGVSDLIKSFRPEAVALEELYSNYKHPKTAIIMGHARGVICLAAARADIPIVPYAATQVKKVTTGAGRAPKSQIQMAVCRELGLAQVPEPPDVADALALALCHFYLSRSQVGTV